MRTVYLFMLASLVVAGCDSSEQQQASAAAAPSVVAASVIKGASEAAGSSSAASLPEPSPPAPAAAEVEMADPVPAVEPKSAPSVSAARSSGASAATSKATRASAPAAALSTSAKAAGSTEHVASAPAVVEASPALALSPAKGSVVRGEGFTAWLAISGGGAKGATATAIVEAVAPYKCNDKYPYKLTLDAAPAGVQLPASPVRNAQIQGKRAMLSFPVRASAPGEYRVGGSLAFSVCTEERCLVERREVSVGVRVR